MRTALKLVTEDSAFTTWHREHKKAYLTSIFMLEDGENFKVGYYDPENKKITSFDSEPFNINPEDDVIGDKIPKELDMNKVKISYTKAMLTARAEKDKKAKNEAVKQTIAILQNLNAQLYNITFVTMAFNIINIRIDAETGEVINTDITNLMGATKIL